MGEAALDGLEGNPAPSPENVRGAGLEPAVVKALIVEMPVHPVEPRRDPAATGLQEADAQLGMALADAAPDHAEAGQHHFHRVTDDVLSGAALEPVDADRRHAARPTFMEADDEI